MGNDSTMTVYGETKEEAIRKWQVWPGHNNRPDRALFLENNPCKEGGLFISDDGDFQLGTSNILFKEELFNEDGTFTISWPLLPGWFNSLFNEEQLLQILKLRVRWCALFRNVTAYRTKITDLLKSNDSENRILNAQLKEWNEYLIPHGFVPFLENDIRGICLAGLDLTGDKYKGINLSNTNISYSECSVLDALGINLYGSILVASSFFYADLSYSTLQSLTAKNSYFSSSSLKGTTLHRSNFSNSIFHKADMDGAQMDNVDIRGTKFSEITKGSIQNNFGRTISFNASRAKGDNKTIADFEFENIEGRKKPKRIWDAIEVKPGIWGISMDLKKLLHRNRESEN